MIIDHAIVLEESTTTLRDREGVARQRSAWLSHSTRLTELCEELDRVSAFLRWLTDSCGEESDGSGLDVVGAARRAMNELVKSLTGSPEAALDDNRILDATQLVASAIRALENCAESAWLEHLDHSEWIPATLWAPLQSHRDHGRYVTQALRQDAEFEALRSVRIPDADARGRFVELQTAHAETLAKLPDISNEAVKQFVVAAGAGGADLSALTPEVLQWLSENDLLRSYLVRQRSSA